MKYIVPVTISDRRAGLVVTVPFFADNAERAHLLADLLRTVMKEPNGGEIASYRNDNTRFLLVNVLEPTGIAM